MATISATIVDCVTIDKKESQFLELWKQMKDHFPEDLRKESGSLLNGPQHEKKLPYDNYRSFLGQYGSFFGQSQLSILLSVLGSKGMLEVQQSAISTSAVLDCVKLDEKESQFLQQRKPLKEHFPEALSNGLGSFGNGPQQEKKMHCHNYGSFLGKYGSFFGQSHLSISEIVLESKGMLEVQQSAATICAAVVDDIKLDKKELQFLQLRKQLKDPFPEELRKESGYLRNSTHREKKLPCDNYGSFCGQSQLSSKGMLEVKQSAASRLENLTAASKAKPDMLIRRPKAYLLKAFRDYSSILSDDVENLTSISGVQSAISSSVMKKHLDETKGICKVERKKLMHNQLHCSGDKVRDQHKIDHKKFSEACKAEAMSKASSSRYSITKKRKSEERIDCKEQKKAKVMQNQQQSILKVQASEVYKVSTPRPQSATKRQSEQGKELHGSNKANVMPGKLQASSQHKVLNESKAFLSKLQSPTKKHMGENKRLEKANKAKTLSKSQVNALSFVCAPGFCLDSNNNKTIPLYHIWHFCLSIASWILIFLGLFVCAPGFCFNALHNAKPAREEKSRRQAKKLKLNQN